MSDKRFSVFISSTFEDLKEERQAVQDVVISAGDFPVQMESFPAADQDQFEFIKTLIDKCDYYVLIVAGRYGNPSEDGLSYTEKEYRYAVAKGIPVLAMLHGARGTISSEKSEDTDKGKERLAAFIAEVEKNRLRKTWNTTDGLKLAVREALDHAKATKGAVGWVRGDTIASLDALEELNEVRKENAKYRDVIGSLEIELALPPMPSADEDILIDILPNSWGRGNLARIGSSATVQATWISIFPIFFKRLQWSSQYSYFIDEDDSCVELGSAIAGETKPVETDKCFRITKVTLDRLSSYYIEAGLMNPAGADEVFTETAKKVARRHSIVGQSQAKFTLVKGKIEVTSQQKDDKEDDIPF